MTISGHDTANHEKDTADPRETQVKAAAGAAGHQRRASL
jgi:hypothetical protein